MNLYKTILFFKLCRKYIFISMFFLVAQHSFAQIEKNNSKHSILRDSLDSKLDISNWLVNANGFVPLVQIITEPALGGFGLMVTPIFIHPNKVQIKGKYIPPNITAAFGGYTANKTWGVGFLRMASLPKQKLKYRFGAAYGNVNMDYYRTLPHFEEVKFSFNIRATPIFASLMREVAKDLYIGVEYFYMKTDVKPMFSFDIPPPILELTELKSNVSSIGIGMEYDTRDNIFSPNKGIQVGANYRVNDSWTGSDYEFQNLNISVFKYFQTTSNWVSGFRLDSKFQFGDAPFFMTPSIDLRGVPASKYQGNSVYIAETEQRYDFSFRWSGVVFTGISKAFNDNNKFENSKVIYNYGVGFRYLLAKLFKLRVGLDVAKSNDDWGYYIVFGSAWNNRN